MPSQFTPRGGWGSTPIRRGMPCVDAWASIGLARMPSATHASTQGMPLRDIRALPAPIVALQNREQFQDVQEQIQDCDEDGDRQANRIGHCIRHILGTLYIIEHIAREDRDTDY